MKKPTLLLLVLVFATLANAQIGELMVKHGDKGLYLDHTVAPKEGLYSIGRLYNVNAKHLAVYNKIDFNKGLNIGQVIRIPLTDTNFNQKTNKGTPVYQIVAQNDVLGKISAQNRKVPLQKLREWNKLPNDNIQLDSKLIVGFLNSKDMAAYMAKNPPVKKVEEKPVVKAETPPPPAQVIQVATGEPVRENAKAVEEVKEVKKPVQDPVKSQPVASTNPAPVFTAETKTTGGSAEEGYFRSSFEQQIKLAPIAKNETVTSGVFKTSSGWQDGKYYLLIDNVPTGTIVKITHPETGRVVYAKVLGEMNGIRQNQGLGIRMSHAAASALGVLDVEKFIVKLNY